MKSRFYIILVIVSALALVSAFQSVSQELLETDESGLPPYKIGIVTDGPLEMKPGIVSTFKNEISQMAETEIAVSFPNSMTIEADSTSEGVRKAIDSLLENAECDLVLALGMIGSTELLSRKEFKKPVVAPFIIDSYLQEAPKNDGTSGIPNLFYIDLDMSVDDSVIAFRKIVPFKQLALFIDERDINGVPAIAKLASYLANEHSITVHLIPTQTSAMDAVEQIPAASDAALIGPLWRFTQKEVELLSSKLAERQIPAFSLSNFEYVEAGMFATLVQAQALSTLARQTAVNIQDIMLGEDPASLPVSFSKGQKLSINMATARAVNVYPSLDYMTGANLLNEERQDIERRVTLPEVVAEAVTVNLDLAVAEQRVMAGRYSVDESKSPLLPQVAIGTGGRTIDDDRASVAQGSSPENVWTGNLSATQEIYSEKSWAGYTVEKHFQSGREFNRDTVELDVILEASTAYLQVLRTKTIEKVQKDNMRLTQANLDRAQIRLSTGVAGPDELYRWQTQFASDRQIVLQAESAALDAMQSLNRILNRPLLEEFIAEELDLSDPLAIGGSELFYELMHNPLYFKKFNTYAIEQGLKASPELKVIDSAIAAKERLVLQSQREYWLPTFSIEADVEQIFANSGEGERIEELTGLDDTDWQVAVWARLPLFEGGRKKATLGRNNEQLLQLSMERKNTEERIRQRILFGLNRTRASYPSINLSRDSVDAARNNLILVTDSYVQGIKSIIDLLDAQNQALIAELDSANAVYDFLIDFMEVQRSVGMFTSFLPEEERNKQIQLARESLGITN